MNGREIFKIWAKNGAMWTEWVRPVHFIELQSKSNCTIPIYIPQIYYLDGFEKNSAIILDLPERYSIEEGLALAQLGWRPIPLYNGVNPQNGVMALIDYQEIEYALIKGAYELQKIKLANNAPPVFLLDTNRTERFKMNVSVFDNSWDLYGQDLPSAGYFLKNGINKIILKSRKIEPDLKPILYKFQKEGIKIYFTDGLNKPKKILIKKPRGI